MIRYAKRLLSPSVFLLVMLYYYVEENAWLWLEKYLVFNSTPLPQIKATGLYFIPIKLNFLLR